MLLVRIWSHLYYRFTFDIGTHTHTRAQPRISFRIHSTTLLFLHDYFFNFNPFCIVGEKASDGLGQPTSGTTYTLIIVPLGWLKI